jgi:hypothetical protein
MIKSQFWKGLLPLILTAVLLSACINVTADYLFQLNDALPNYDTWIEEVVIPYNKMLDSRTNGNPEVTYGQLITNTFQNYLAGDPRRADLTWDAADLQVVKEQAQLV